MVNAKFVSFVNNLIAMEDVEYVRSARSQTVQESVCVISVVTKIVVVFVSALNVGNRSVMENVQNARNADNSIVMEAVVKRK